VFINEKEGELILSRDLEKISIVHHASAVVVGTYVDTKNVFYVSAKIVSPSDGVVVSAFDSEVPVTNRSKT
jgi:hypothetical protein